MLLVLHELFVQKYSGMNVVSLRFWRASIRALKLYGWEGAFGERVGKARTEELDASGRIVRLRSMLAAVFSSTPTLVAVTHVSRNV